MATTDPAEPTATDPQDYLTRFVHASLGPCDYTPYGPDWDLEQDGADYERALDNITEMHQLLRQRATVNQVLTTDLAHARVLHDQLLYDVLLDQVGFRDGAEVTADGSAGNDLAVERAQVVLEFIQLAARSPLPAKLINRPPVEPTT